MRKSRLLTKAASIILACTMIVGSTGITTFAETGHTAYENIKECNVTVEVEDSNEIVSAEEESSNTMYNNVEECDIPVAVEEVAETNDIVYADAESETYHYYMKNGNNYMICNNTNESVDAQQLIRLENSSNIDRTVEYVSYDSNGTYIDAIRGTEFDVNHDRIPAGGYCLITISGTNSEDYLYDISIPYEYYRKGLDIKESDKPPFYSYVLNNKESCKISNPTDKYTDICIFNNTTTEDNVFEYSKFNNFKITGDYDYGFASVFSGKIQGSNGGVEGNDSWQVITLNNDKFENVTLYIPYEYYEQGVTIEKSESPALYHFTLEKDKNYILTADFSSIDECCLCKPIKVLMDTDCELEYSCYNKNGSCIGDYGKVSNDESTYTRVNIEKGGKTLCRVSKDSKACTSYIFFETGVEIDVSEETPLYKCLLERGKSYKISNVSSNKKFANMRSDLKYGERICSSVTYKTKYGVEYIKSSSFLNYKVDTDLDPGEYQVITIEDTGRDVEVYMPYDYYEKVLRIESSNTPAYYTDYIKPGECYEIKYEGAYGVDIYLGKGNQRFYYTVYKDDIDKSKLLSFTTKENNELRVGGNKLCIYASKYNVCDIVYFIPYNMLTLERVSINSIDLSIDEADRSEMITDSDGKKYWYENGIKQGTEGRGKEIYDPETDAWYWLDAIQGGAVATSKDVYQESNGGKWVRYDENGHMIKGWDTNENGKYYFDPITGAMSKGEVEIDGQVYCFNADTGILCNNEFFVKDGNRYWYENGIRQGTVGRGKEIYDPATNAWYWLDAIDGGKVATGKDLYQESAAGEWAEDKTTGTGKWVRYDENGYMVKGWYTNENGTYYFDLIYGTMAKGTVSIDGTSYYFNETTGILQ